MRVKPNEVWDYGNDPFGRVVSQFEIAALLRVEGEVMIWLHIACDCGETPEVTIYMLMKVLAAL